MTQERVRIAAVIPARMASARFEGKPLHPFRGLPMVEHVRRRAALCPGFDEVVVATCDAAIAEAVRRHGGDVVMTSADHPTGTDRVAEAVKEIDCTHVMILQGDEPLLLPEWLEGFAAAIRQQPGIGAWNATARLADVAELEEPSVVKCVVSRGGRILLCFRRSPCLSTFAGQRAFVRKIVGVIAFERTRLLWLSALPPSPFEEAEGVEQSRILEHDEPIQSVDWPEGYPSVNVPSDVELVERALSEDPRQREILAEILDQGVPVPMRPEPR